MACNCITVMNDKMREKNSRVLGTLCFPREGTKLKEPYEVVTLECEKIEPRKRDKVIALATFCPFCGVRYVPASEPEPEPDRAATV